MRVLINSLSVGHLSGQHVVYGFLDPLFRWTSDEHEFVLLHYEGAPPPAHLAAHKHVALVTVSNRLRSWVRRSIWEQFALPALVRKHRTDIVFSPSGAITPACRGIRQVSLAQNPWCFVKAARSGWTQDAKAALQRRAYRYAIRNADLMLFISDYLRGLYRGAGPLDREAPTDIAHVALNEETHRAAEQARATVEKEPDLIVSVSAMAPWKGVETVVEALALLHRRKCAARLRLVGPWPDPVYEAGIRRQIAELDLEKWVEITGMVSKAALHLEYARAKVFCLMSTCESFGIPAAEAQAFATPVIAAEECAIPEVCRDAGRFGPAANPQWTADALEHVLYDESEWSRYSRQAVVNAGRLRWELCARPFLRMFSCA